ncbi:MAG: hypothetical protein L6Q37_06630 [Bdellovibrionaceae bacterium]|nr:hypothetical protein [Pseudobdellovibrionaceae bacterium]NUM59820.1 hypothetical protein [Pseudobdellovibrionaceae bacterium]
MCDSKLVPLDQMILSYPRVEISKIEELKSFDLSGNLLSELIDIFKSEFELNLPLMKEMLKNEDFEMLSKMSHRLRSTGFNSGARRVSEILKKIEIELTDSETSKAEINIMINSLEYEVFKTRIELERHIKS